MGIRPSFQFYPGDWMSDKELRRCSHELKGIWIDLLCILHDSDEYGILRWTMDELAQAVGTTTSKVKRLFDYGILKGGPMDTMVNGYTHVTKDGIEETLIPAQKGPLFYCKRMVKDEHLRQKRGSHGVKSIYNDNVPKKKASKDTIVNDKDDSKDTIQVSPSSPSSSSSSSSSTSLLRGSAKPKDDPGQEQEIRLLYSKGLARAIIAQYGSFLIITKDIELDPETEMLFDKIWTACDQSYPREYLLAFILTSFGKKDPQAFLITVLTRAKHSPSVDSMARAKKLFEKWDNSPKIEDVA